MTEEKKVTKPEKPMTTAMTVRQRVKAGVEAQTMHVNKRAEAFMKAFDEERRYRMTLEKSAHSVARSLILAEQRLVEVAGELNAVKQTRNITTDILVSQTTASLHRAVESQFLELIKMISTDNEIIRETVQNIVIAALHRVLDQRITPK